MTALDQPNFFVITGLNHVVNEHLGLKILFVMTEFVKTEFVIT